MRHCVIAVEFALNTLRRSFAVRCCRTLIGEVIDPLWTVNYLDWGTRTLMSSKGEDSFPFEL